jgi:glycosyltransferase involved in cell wall biosynthesis
VKIVVIEFAGKGGMAHYVFQLCRAMAGAGEDVTLITEKNYELESLPRGFTLETTIDLWDPKPAGKMSMTPWAVGWRKLRRVGRAVRYYGQWLQLIKRVVALRPDVVQLGDIRFPFDLFPLLLLRRKVKYLTEVCHNVRPYATGGKGVGLFDRSRFRRFFYTRIYRLFDTVFVHFERNRREFRETFGVPDSKIGVIVHGNEEIFSELADPRVDAAVLRQRLKIPEGERVVLFFGTLSRYKGTDTLINAFPRIHRETGARLVLAGFPFHGFDLEAHRALTRTLGIESHVTWSPEYVASEEIEAWMRFASVVVFPYRDIYQSGALHVAQTFGVPIVASAVGAMQDVIEHEVSGLLVPPENADALADAIIRLLNDPELAARVSANTLADAQGRFSWRSIAGIVLDKYRERDATAPR